jgi:hypothetical protein
VIGAFFDDSGTHGDSSLVAMGGLLGTDPQWDEFVERWAEILKAPVPDKPPLPQFHMDLAVLVLAILPITALLSATTSRTAFDRSSLKVGSLP